MVLRSEKNRIKKIFRIMSKEISDRPEASINYSDIDLLDKQIKEYQTRIKEIETDLKDNCPKEAGEYMGHTMFYMWRPAYQALGQKQQQLQRIEDLKTRILNEKA